MATRDDLLIVNIVYDDALVLTLEYLSHALRPAERIPVAGAQVAQSRLGRLATRLWLGSCRARWTRCTRGHSRRTASGQSRNGALHSGTGNGLSERSIIKIPLQTISIESFTYLQIIPIHRRDDLHLQTRRSRALDQIHNLLVRVPLDIYSCNVHNKVPFLDSSQLQEN